MSEVERIAREAVALCADLLRRYAPYGMPGGIEREQGWQRTGYESTEQIDTWGRRVLAWQDQLDQGSRSPAHQDPIFNPQDLVSPAPNPPDQTGRLIGVEEDGGQPPSPVPRVWKKGDPEPPADVRQVLDCDGRTWLRRVGYRHIWDAEAPLPVAYGINALLADYGPLTEVVQDGSNPDGGGGQ